MFIRQKKNKSGSVSVQIISKDKGKYRVFRTIGSGRSKEEIENLLHRANQELTNIEGKSSIFSSLEDTFIKNYLSNLKNSQVQVIGPELIFGKIYDYIGYNLIESQMFRYLVITRLYHPGSKLKTIDYLQRFLGVFKEIDEIYRFMDKLNSQLKREVERISYEHTKRILGGEISIVFYDLTTLHFEASDEDDLRRTGFSKVGKHQNPQIYLGLLVGMQGYAIGYDIFEGNIFEGHTLLPTIQKFEERYNLNKPIIVADAGLLSRKNIELLQSNNYQYIIGARIKNETRAIKSKILEQRWRDGELIALQKDDQTKIIVSYSDKRAAKDFRNRRRGLLR